VDCGFADDAGAAVSGDIMLADYERRVGGLGKWSDLRTMSSIPASPFRSMKLNTHRTTAHPVSPQAKISPPMAQRPVGEFTQC
jgi:hypothetical protein